MMIREATEEDWPRIYPFFAEIVAAGTTYTYPEDLTSAQARTLWMQPLPARTVVAVEGAGRGPVVLGSATMGPNRPGRGSHVATAGFMVDPQYAGRGVGRALGEHVVDWARATGYRAIQFNAVVETNTTAVRLWRSLGFEVLATVPEAFDHPEHGYVGLHVICCGCAQNRPRRRLNATDLRRRRLDRRDERRGRARRLDRSFPGGTSV